MTDPNDLIARLSEAAEGCDSHEFVGLLACDLRAIIAALQSAEAMRRCQALASQHQPDDAAGKIVAWLRSFEGQDARAIAAGECTRYSTTHGELRDQAAYYAEVAAAIERGDHLKS